MNQLTEQQMRVHVPVVAWLLIALNSIVLLVALFVFVLMGSLVGLVRDPEGGTILAIVGTLLPALMAALTLPDFIAAFGLLARQRWARILGIVVGFLNLPGFPFGTLVGAYTIFVLMQDAAGGYLTPPSAHSHNALQPA